MQEPAIYEYRYVWDAKHSPKRIGPMAQDVQEVFPEKVVSVSSYLYLKLDDLPSGITAFDLYQPVHPAGYSAAMARWQKVFTHWSSQKEKT